MYNHINKNEKLQFFISMSSHEVIAGRIVSFSYPFSIPTVSTTANLGLLPDEVTLS